MTISRSHQHQACETVCQVCGSHPPKLNSGCGKAQNFKWVMQLSQPIQTETAKFAPKKSTCLRTIWNLFQIVKGWYRRCIRPHDLSLTMNVSFQSDHAWHFMFALVYTSQSTRFLSRNIGVVLLCVTPLNARICTSSLNSLEIIFTRGEPLVVETRPCKRRIATKKVLSWIATYEKTQSTETAKHQSGK